MVDVFLQPWSKTDLLLLQKLLGDPAIMKHPGGASQFMKSAGWSCLPIRAKAAGAAIEYARLKLR